MARFYPIGATGGGVGSDDCTGTVDELLKGYTAVLRGSGDEPAQGRLELTGDAQEGNVLTGSTFYNTDPKNKRAGTMPNRGGYNGWGKSKGNDAGNQRMWVKIPQGYYNENANVFLSWADIRNMAGITAVKIKKGESIMGIIGSFEGWVPTPQDLYYNGVNVNGILKLNNAIFENTRILLTSDTQNTLAFYFTKDIDVRSYSRLVFEGAFFQMYNNGFMANLNGPSGSTLVSITSATTNTFQFDITQLTTIPANSYLMFTMFLANRQSYITRIRLA